ncbi:MAG: pantoate--beta-alanine ligase [Deltaproteobacteria bacterium]|nr:pantoate--beta-alanine ligase [Deltaproteobacteria bacterium]
MTRIIKSPRGMQRWSLEPNRQIGFVCTMGALHEGHLSLIREARRQCKDVVVSILVNPLQFGPNEDYGAYPRTFEADYEACEQIGVDIIFAPEVSQIYPKDFQTRVIGSDLNRLYCGVTRPVFFNGVLTVVNILYNIVQPQKGFWGEKDFQQMHLVRQMAKDFFWPAEIIGMPIIREENGLAMSSRNNYLTNAQKEEAACLFRGILAAQEAFKTGERNSKALIEVAQKQITLEIDYLALVSAKTLMPIEGQVTEPTRLLLAAYIGQAPRVRLIDNGSLSA